MKPVSTNPYTQPFLKTHECLPSTKTFMCYRQIDAANSAMVEVFVRLEDALAGMVTTEMRASTQIARTLLFTST